MRKDRYNQPADDWEVYSLKRTAYPVREVAVMCLAALGVIVAFGFALTHFA